MSVGELARLFTEKPLAAVAALAVLAVCAQFVVILRAYARMLRASEVYAYDLAKMLDIQRRTLDLFGRALAVLEHPSVHKLLNGGSRRHRGNDNDDE